MKPERFFNSIGIVVVAGALCITLSVHSGYSQSSMTINVNGAAAVVPDGMYGSLMERLGRQWSGQGAIFVGTGSTIPNTNGMRNDVIAALKECGLGAAQWPGGCAAWGYRWSPPDPSNDVGTDRFLEFCQLVGCEPIICGPHYPTSYASNLAWVKHIDSVTAKLGMDSLRWFKIGNEVWGGCGEGMDAPTYCANYLASYTPMKAYRSSLKFEGGSQNEDRGYAQVSSFYQTQIATLGTKLDGVEYHDYIFRTTWPSLTFSTQQYWQIMYDGLVGDFAGHMKTNVIPVLDAADPAKRIKLIVDEWGDWLAGDNWMQTATLMDALSAANHLHLMMSHSDRIEIACIAQGVNVIHSLLNINTSGVMIKTPTFYIFKMFKAHHAHGAKWAPITASNIQTTTQSTAVSGNATMPLMTVGSTVDTNGRVNISVNNIDLTASRQITVNLNSDQAVYVLDSAQIITGPAMNSNNPFGGPELVNIQNFAASNITLTNNGKTLTATLPARSIVMIRLKTLPDTSALHGSLLNSVPDAFSIKAGSRGSVLITSSMSRKTPLTISLYSIDGRSLVESYAGTLDAGQNSLIWQPENRNLGSNMYIVIMKAGAIMKAQRIMF